MPTHPRLHSAASVRLLGDTGLPRIPAAPKEAAPALEGHFAQASAARLCTLLRPGCLWVTDADGTLWADDLGEGFLQSLIAEGALVSEAVRGRDVWATYQGEVAKDKGRGYAWAVQAMAGMREVEIVRRARAFAAQFVPAHLYAGMRALLAEASARGSAPWIVSASNRWVVQAAAEVLGLDSRHVIGMATRVRGGTLTDEVDEPLVYAEGKAAAVEACLGARPTLASGDSEGDRPMLDASLAALLVLHPGKTSPALLAHARQRGWLVQSFEEAR